MSDSFGPYGLYPSRLLCPWDSPGKNTGMGCHALLHHFAHKGPYSQSYSFSSSHVWMWEAEHKEIWVPKNWCFWTVILEKMLESILDCKEIKPVNPKGNQSWIFTGRTDTAAKTLILWPPDAKNWLIKKDPGARKYWRQKKWGTEDEMVGWHHQLNGHEFEKTPGDCEGQISLVCCSPWGHRVRHDLETEQQGMRNNGEKVCEIKY